MTLAKIEKLHSNAELVLALVNNYCEKHREEPQFCGATKEARGVLGDILKAAGIVLCAAALIKAIK